MATNGNHRTVNEMLAVTVNTTPEDDSLALKFSPLEGAKGKIRQKHDLWYWYVLFVPLNLVAAFNALTCLCFRVLMWLLMPWVKVKVSKLRMSLGPKLYNELLGKIVHPLVLTIREGVTTSAACDALYATDRYFPAYLESLRGKRWGWLRVPGTLLTWLICNLPGPQSIRNRLYLVYQNILDELERQAELKKEIKMLVLACGSAEATFFAIRDFLLGHLGHKVSLVLVDKSGSSLRRAMRLAEHLGLADNVTCVESDLRDYLKDVAAESFDIVEMVGFFDYRPAKSIIGLSAAVLRVVRIDGMFITANTAPSPSHDEFMVRFLIGWPGLVRRTEEEFIELLRHAGWKNIGTVMEQHRIHTIATCHRCSFAGRGVADTPELELRSSQTNSVGRILKNGCALLF